MEIVLIAIVALWLLSGGRRGFIHLGEATKRRRR
jgi:hypothetical protein